MSRSIMLTLNDILQQAKYTLQVPALIEQAIQHQIILATAEAEGLSIGTTELQKTADQLRVEHKLITASDTLQWLETHHCRSKTLRT